jgi:Asp-tRNA(Asn)/Glu-tRNA(Gln) amidotransferase B subunit
MKNIRIWAPESDTDSKTILCIAEKILHYHKLNNPECEGAKLWQVGNKAYVDVATKPEGLKKAVEAYLKTDDLVIFLLDSDGVQSQAARKNQANSYINKITQVVKQMAGKAVLIYICQELEAWLLIDILGICCFYTNSTTTRSKEEWIKFANKHQVGKTDLIAEAVMGGKNAKESLIEVSSKILKKANPKLKEKNIKNNRYDETLSDRVAECIEINKDTIQRNDSLVEFSKYLTIAL